MRTAVTTLLLVVLLPTALHAEIYECVDENGNRRFTNIKAEARGCRVLNIGPTNTVPPPAKSAPKTPSAASGNFPKVDAQTQQQRDVDRRTILEQELASEQKLLEQAKKELADQEAVRYGNERNYQRVLDRLDPYKKRVKLHEDNIANLRKELASIR
jgi:hypothetical protein